MSASTVAVRAATSGFLGSLFIAVAAGSVFAATANIGETRYELERHALPDIPTVGVANWQDRINPHGVWLGETNGVLGQLDRVRISSAVRPWRLHRSMVNDWDVSSYLERGSMLISPPEQAWRTLAHSGAWSGTSSRSDLRISTTGPPVDSANASQSMGARFGYSGLGKDVAFSRPVMDLISGSHATERGVPAGGAVGPAWQATVYGSQWKNFGRGAVVSDYAFRYGQENWPRWGISSGTGIPVFGEYQRRVVDAQLWQSLAEPELDIGMQVRRDDGPWQTAGYNPSLIPPQQTVAIFAGWQPRAWRFSFAWEHGTTAPQAAAVNWLQPSGVLWEPVRSGTDNALRATAGGALVSWQSVRLASSFTGSGYWYDPVYTSQVLLFADTGAREAKVELRKASHWQLVNRTGFSGEHTTSNADLAWRAEVVVAETFMPSSQRLKTALGADLSLRWAIEKAIWRLSVEASRETLTSTLNELQYLDGSYASVAIPATGFPAWKDNALLDDTGVRTPAANILLLAQRLRLTQASSLRLDLFGGLVDGQWRLINQAGKAAVGIGSSSPWWYGLTLGTQTQKETWSLAWSLTAYNHIGHTAAGNGPLSNTIGSLSFYDLVPSLQTRSYANTWEDRAFLTRLTIGHRVVRPVWFFWALSHRDGTPFAYFADVNSGTLRYDTNRGSPLQGRPLIGPRTDFRFNLDWRVRYVVERRGIWTVQAALLNVLDFGNEWLESHQPGAQQQRAALLQEAPRAVQLDCSVQF